MRNQAAISTITADENTGLDTWPELPDTAAIARQFLNDEKGAQSEFSNQQGGETATYFGFGQSNKKPTQSRGNSAKVDAESSLDALREPLKSQKSEVASFVNLQEWEGYVTKIDEESFTARLLDISSGKEIEDEEVDIPLSDISTTDREELSVGSIFRWSIGYEIKRDKQRKRTSQIVLRRLPMWREKELIDAKTIGRERAAKILWDDS